MMKITEGKYSGREFEEPEFEGMAAFSGLVGIDDVTMSVVLSSEADRLGVDVNETGWIMAWVIDCYENGFLTKDDNDGLEMTWGNGDAILTMLNRIARREGFGNILAEGVMRAARHVGGEAQNKAIHTMKGNTPRSHDHRMMWLELFDTCVSNLGTLETSGPIMDFGMPADFDMFDPMATSTMEANVKGAMVFDDSLAICRWNTLGTLKPLCQAVNAATGWDMDFQEALTVGRRAVNLARVFNLRNGIGADLDAPSARYGSTPSDGIVAGRGIMPHWDKMLRNYYHLMGWDEATGIPLPETLSSLGLEDIIPDLIE